ncbi:DUF5681 domain-containing protein [Nitrobacter sp. TKz-YC01]|uniref:DUF5681 domain-containing protein n=1 Tax=Nitrobacter sp. TKz-YC01 TaxID=3398703 RepID=UPI003A0FDED4
MNKKSSSRKSPNPGWFPKGRSGNLKGRPTSSRSKASAFEVLVEKTLTVDGQGGIREITVEEALQQRTYQDALAGKRMAIREVVKWIIKREAWLEKNAPRPSRQVIWRDTEHDPDNADAALLLLGITTRNPDRAEICGRAQLLLEPWAVQAALRRRRGGQRLTDKECDEIRRCTRDPKSLRWPRGTGE